MQCVDALSAQILLVVVVLDAGDDLRDDGVERGGHAQPLAVARDGAVEHGDLRLALVQHGVLRHGRIVVAEVGDDVRLFLFHERPEIADAERLRDGAALFPHMHDDVVAVGVGEGLLHLQAHDGAHAVIAAVGDDFLPDVRAHVFVKARVAAARLEARLERLAGAGGIVKSLINLPDIICNLVIIALLILLSIFGVDLIIKASTVLSTAILIVTAILVVMGFVVPIDAVAQELATENAAYASIPAIADVTSQKGLEGVWRGVFVYAAFQCVSVPAMIAASTELTHKGVKRASILGWLMNGGALAASGAMLLRWYPILTTIKSVGVDTVASIAARHIGDVMKLPNQSVVTLMGSGYTWLFVVYTILLFCAFVSTSVTLVYSMIQRFEGHCFPKAIKSKGVRSVIVGLIVIGLCYAVSLLGLSTIISKIYGYDGYYALIVVVLPAFIWGIPKIKKLSADKKAELSE